MYKRQFYTYEEFEQACSIDPDDDYSLVYYAVNMAESIQNQLDGGEPTFDASSLKGGGMGGGKGGMPDFGGEKSDGENADIGTKQNGNRPDGMQGGPSGMGGEGRMQQVRLKEYLPMILVCGGVFVIGTVFLAVFKRKKELKPPKGN